MEAMSWSHAVAQFLRAHRRLPSTLFEVTQPDPAFDNEPYLDRDPIDPWGNDYLYAKTAAGGWLIVSLGADGEPGGAHEDADIVSAHLPQCR